MRQIPWVGCGLLLSLASVLADTAEEARKGLQGTWVATAAQRDGKPVPEVIGHRLTFSGEGFTIRSSADKVLYQGTYRLDQDTTPASIDFKHTEGDAKGKVWKGIYSREGDQLRICDNAANPEKARPSSFDTKPDSGAVFVTLKRAKP
jgi:uncharacterized protein (TIGR03067 family)